jgi:hypothetical protein
MADGTIREDEPEGGTDAAGTITVKKPAKKAAKKSADKADTDEA